jgi:hypothetical protein
MTGHRRELELGKLRNAAALHDIAGRSPAASHVLIATGRTAIFNAVTLT